MSRMSLLNSPLLLGFDEIERLLDSVTKGASDGYPPYNIERLKPEQGHGETLRITLAVAGFGRDELDISVENKQLTITGKQHEDRSRDFLYRGIAARQFKKSFVLADDIEVMGADLINGLLSIDLVRPQKESLIQKIEIGQQDIPQ